MTKRFKLHLSASALSVLSLMSYAHQLIASDRTNQSTENTSSNDVTIRSYELGSREYIAKTPREISENFKAWIDTTLSFLPSDARIIEMSVFDLTSIPIPLSIIGKISPFL